MKYNKIKLDNWAIKLTKVNKLIVATYFNTFHNTTLQFTAYNSLYGIKNNNVGCGLKDNCYEKILSFEEFLSLITNNSVETNIIENDYDIY